MWFLWARLSTMDMAAFERTWTRSKLSTQTKAEDEGSALPFGVHVPAGQIWELRCWCVRNVHSLCKRSIFTFMKKGDSMFQWMSLIRSFDLWPFLTMLPSSDKSREYFSFWRSCTAETWWNLWLRVVPLSCCCSTCWAEAHLHGDIHTVSLSSGY